LSIHKKTLIIKKESSKFLKIKKIKTRKYKQKNKYYQQKMVKINPLKLRKLGAIFKLSQNPQSFFVFFISLFIFGKGELKTKIRKEIKVSKGENILT